MLIFLKVFSLLTSIKKGILFDTFAYRRKEDDDAAHFGLTLGEMLRTGENLLSGRIVFPWSRPALSGISPTRQKVLQFIV